MPNNLHRILNERHLTYQELSIMVKDLRGEGISEGTLTKIIKYDHYPSDETRHILSIVLDVPESTIWLE